jgi:hypothetical protein
MCYGVVERPMLLEAARTSIFVALTAVAVAFGTHSCYMHTSVRLKEVRIDPLLATCSTTDDIYTFDQYAYAIQISI